MDALKRFAGYLVLTTVVPFLMLLSLEGLTSMGMLAREIAAIRPPAELPQVTRDTLLGWVGRPNVALPNHFGPNLGLTHDAAGMRAHRPPADAPPRDSRGIVCSGGSLTYGAGVADSQTVCAHLERELPGVRTYIMGQQGFGIDQAYLWYRRDGGSRPHRLHLFAFTRADFDRMARSYDRAYAKPVLAVRSGEIVAENVPVPDRLPAIRWPEISAVLSDSRVMQAIERRTGRAEARRAREDERSRRDAQAVFRDLDRLSRERGSRLVLVYLPALSDLRPGPYDDRRAELATFASQAGVPFIDLTDGMRAVPADSSDWYFITPNLRSARGVAGLYSAAGHRWSATRVAERLRAMPDVAGALGAAP